MCRHLKFANEAFTITCAVHVEDCEGLSGDRSSVAEHWQLAQTRNPGFNSCHLPTFLLPKPSFLLTLQLLTEQEKALKERIRDLEAVNAENKMDPTHLAKLEKQVQQFQKGEQTMFCFSRALLPIGQLFFPLVM